MSFNGKSYIIKRFFWIKDILEDYVVVFFRRFCELRVFFIILVVSIVIYDDIINGSIMFIYLFGSRLYYNVSILF